MRISVIGVGYVGLVTGACFAETGNHVVCMDIDSDKIERLKKGNIPIYEPHLEEIVKNNIEEGRLEFTDQVEVAVRHGLIVFIAVNTPQDRDGSADLKYVLEAASDVGKNLEKYRVIVVKSTVPVGTSEKVGEVIAEEVTKRGLDVDYDIASNPEFLKEGTAVEDCKKPERVVVGVKNSRTEEILRDLYAPFLRTGAPFLVMDHRSSELTKYAANAMLATRISFMNQLANVCEKTGADVMNVIKGVGTDSRIGPKFLFPGVGFGGSCFPKDVRALMRTCDDRGYCFSILKQVIEANEIQKVNFVDKIRDYFDGELKGKRFAIWGLAFKPNTDDVREAPAIDIVNSLLDEGVSCSVYDPKAMENAAAVLNGKSGLTFACDQYHVLEAADALILLTEWLSFRAPDFDQMKTLMKKPVIFDGRNQYNPVILAKLGFRYFSVGRPYV